MSFINQFLEEMRRRRVFRAATVYIVIGVFFEERALKRQWGADYDDYRSRVRSIVPTLRP